MFPGRAQEISRRPKRTVLVYFLLIVGILGVAGYTARNVIFRPWTVRNWVAAAAVGQDIFVFGGRTRDNALYDDVIHVDVRKKTLKRIAKLPAKCFAMQALTVNDRIYLIGGYSESRYIVDILEYDPATTSFRVIGKLPEPRAFGDAVLIDDKMYYLGGWSGKSYATEVFEIDPATGRVEIVGSLPEPREYFAAVAYQDKLYMLGGEDGQENLDEIVEIDPLNWEIQRKDALPSPRLHVIPAVVEGRCYAIGGWQHAQLDDVLELEPSSETLELKTVGHLPEVIAGMAPVIIGPDLYLIGGEGDTTGHQIGVLHVDMRTLKATPIFLKSYVWW